MNVPKLGKFRLAIFAIAFVALAASAAGGLLLLRDEQARIRIWRMPLVQFGVHTYRSLRKIADLPYSVYLARTDSLPIYDVVVNPENVALMNAALPDDMIKGRLLDDNKVKISGDFAAGGYQEKIKIRYRGRGPNHWNALKKSYQIDFPDEHPFAGYTRMKFNIPEDRGYIVEPLNFYRAAKLGLFAPQPWFSKLRLNGQNIGVYFTLPHWSKELAELGRRPDTSNIFGIRDLPREETLARNFFEPENIDYWEDYTENDLARPEDRAALKEFLSILSYAPDTTFERVLPAIADMDSIYSWLILNTLAGSNHQNIHNNIIILRDPSTGKFQPIPWDTQLYPYEPLDLPHHPLIGRTLSIPQFREEFLRRLEAYVSNEENLAENLRIMYVALTRAVCRCYLFWGRINGAGTSAPAYIFHNCRDDNNFKDSDDSTMYGELLKLDDRKTISVAEIPPGKEGGYEEEKQETELDSAKEFTGMIDKNWSITSYSGLVFTSGKSVDEPDRDFYEDTVITERSDFLTDDSGGEEEIGTFDFQCNTIFETDWITHNNVQVFCQILRQS